jgi:hypothetical protein
MWGSDSRDWRETVWGWLTSVKRFPEHSRGWVLEQAYEQDQATVECLRQGGDLFQGLHLLGKECQ